MTQTYPHFGSGYTVNQVCHVKLHRLCIFQPKESNNHVDENVYNPFSAHSRFTISSINAIITPDSG